MRQSEDVKKRRVEMVVNTFGFSEPLTLINGRKSSNGSDFRNAFSTGSQVVNESIVEGRKGVEREKTRHDFGMSL